MFLYERSKNLYLYKKINLHFIRAPFFFKLKPNYTFNHSEDGIPKAVKVSTALNLSKTDGTHETNDLNFSPTAAASYEKNDSKWRLSPNCKYIFIEKENFIQTLFHFEKYKMKTKNFLFWI